MARKGLDRYGNPLPGRPLHPDEEAKLLPLPGFEHLIGPPIVPSSANRAELHDSLRPRRARKVRPRSLEYRFWQEVREGDRVLVDSLLEGVVEDTGVHVEKGEVVRIVNYSVVRLDSGDTIEVQDHARMKRVPEGT
jgi:hypothetical protein